MEFEQVKNDQIVLTNIKRFEMFFNEHYIPLVNYANTFLRNPEESEDKVQHVFISLWEKRKTIELHTSLRAFMYKSVYNACLNQIKYTKVRDTYAQDYSKDKIFNKADTVIEDREIQQKMDSVIESLPEQCRKIFIMSRFDHLKYREIADELGLSIKTIENQMGKALRIMRESLKEYLPFILLLFI